MGWCSATEIMDAALKAAETAMRAAMQAIGGVDLATTTDAQWVDNLLRPFVATMARMLKDGGWDCEEESEYFNRFPQEILGYDHQRYGEFIREQLSDEGTANDFYLKEYAKWLAK